MEKCSQRVARNLIAWFDRNARDLPWRRTADPYAIWISEIMLQQTQVKTVIPYFERWIRELPTIADFARAKPEKVLKLWEGLGYYRRARHAQKAAQVILDSHGGQFPSRLEQILELPGIGRYTAGAISSIAFHQPAPILDGNVMRVLCRIFGIAGDPRQKATNAKLWRMAGELVSLDLENCSNLNQSLMELGALICIPRAPRCESCPVKQSCFAFKTSRVDEFPQRMTRPKITERRFVALVHRKGNKFLVRQRPADVVNGGLWEFPNVEVGLDGKNGKDRPFCQVRHSITRYRILLEAFYAKNMPQTLGVWKTLQQLDRLPLASAHRKILEVLHSGCSVEPLARKSAHSADATTIQKKARSNRSGP